MDAQATPAVVTEATGNEAGFSLNWSMTDREGCQVSVTMRTARLQDWRAAMSNRKEFVDRALEAGWAFPARLQAPPPAVAATAPAAANGASPAPAAAPGGRQTLLAVKLTVTPRADGKVELGWFEAGHQWADVKAVKTPADALTVLAKTGGWTLENVSKPGEYGVQHLVEWVPSSNLNKSGKPYKNLVAVSPAA
jgi:hypothetical protein